jgi:polyisoprenoid-binding protein YceI
MKNPNVSFNVMFCLLFCLFVNTQALADWQLSNGQSAISFVSTKNQHVSEIHHFTQLSGSLSEQGQLTIEIDLASVETGIDIRNTRMREKLFMVEQFPNATISAKVPANVMQLKAGESLQLKLPATLKIMNFENPIKVSVQISKTASGQFIATSTQAILISANGYGLVPGLDLLQKLAGLSSIGHTVPVSFNVVFAQQ